MKHKKQVKVSKKPRKVVEDSKLPPFVETLFPKTDGKNEPLIDDLLIRHPEFDLVMASLEGLDEIDRTVLNEHCLLLTGESRLGKTRLLAEFIAKRMPKRTQDGLLIPVLYIEVPEHPTIRSMAAALLREFGEKPGKRDSADEMLESIVTLARNTGVRVVCFDDLHHFVDQRGRTMQYELTEWLKRLVIKMRVALVICGLGRTESAIRLNEQLYGRMDQKLHLRRFDWRIPSDRDQFSEIVDGICESIREEFKISSTGRDWQFRWYLACSGRMGYLVKITRRALKMARKAGVKEICLETLHAAWIKSVFDAASLPAIQHPFTKAFALGPDEVTIQRAMSTGVEEPVVYRRNGRSGAAGDGSQKQSKKTTKNAVQKATRK